MALEENRRKAIESALKKGKIVVIVERKDERYGRRAEKVPSTAEVIEL